MRTSTNVKYIKSALHALREMGEATAGEVAKKIGEDSGSVSFISCLYGSEESFMFCNNSC